MRGSESDDILVARGQLVSDSRGYQRTNAKGGRHVATICATLMAMGRLRRVPLYLGLFIVATGLSYKIFWHSASIRTHLVSTPGSNDSMGSSCLSDLLFQFGVTKLNISAPTYVHLAQPRPISSSCDSLIPRSGNTSAVTDFVKQEPLSTDEQTEIHSIMHRLLGNFSQRNLQFFLAGGSLLGSMRHFGHFPWDADADVMIPASQKPQIRQLLIDLSASGEMRFADTEKVFRHWQIGIFCPADRNRSSQHYGVVTSLKQPNPAGKPCKTIVDFFFGNAGAKHYTRHDYPGTFPMEDVYPLTLRPYGPYLMPVPRNPGNFLAAVYGKDYEETCLFKYFHKTYRCADLRAIYPFVSHLRLPYKDRQLSVDLLVHGSNMASLFIPEQ